MIDKELLEMAAKAHGLKVDRFSECGHYIYTPSLGKWWSPLMDDGDALRLAVALGIIINPDKLEERSIAEWGDAEQRIRYWHGLNNIGAGAATRYAITAAAADIGKSNPA